MSRNQQPKPKTSFSFTQILVAVLGLVAQALASRTPPPSEVSDEGLKEQLEAARRERHQAVTDLIAPHIESGDLSTDQHLQILQVVDAAAASTPHDEIKPPEELGAEELGLLQPQKAAGESAE